MNDRLTILQGDALEQLSKLPAQSVQCCVTSPPYWGLRDYGVAGQIGLEPTPEEYVAKLVSVFAEVRRVLRDDGTLWLNLGDSFYRAPEKGGSGPGNKGNCENGLDEARRLLIGSKRPTGLKPKDLVGIPWRVAFALQAADWYLRSDIIWHKPNPMPESVTDRPTKSHEYIFLLSKSERYHYDAGAIKEPASKGTHERYRRAHAEHCPPGQTRHGGIVGPRKRAPNGSGIKNNESFDAAMAVMPSERNKRTVWTVPTESYSEAHFATFPRDLIKPCILAGCPVGGVVLDPFGGSGTTAAVALELGCKAILIELNPEYIELAEARTNITPGLALEQFPVTNGPV